jgi:hypothetical protein
MADEQAWPDASNYGHRFEEIDAQLQRSFSNAEFRWRNPETAGRLRYRLAKIAIAGEDVRRAVGMLAHEKLGDEEKAIALVELRNACQEITDSFAEIDGDLIALLNRTSN